MVASTDMKLSNCSVLLLGSGSQDLSYSTKRKMSQRQKRTRVHRGTQTEEQYFQDPLPRELNGEGEYYGDRGPQERLVKAEEVSMVKCPKISNIFLCSQIKYWSSGPEVKKLFSCSTQLSTKFQLLIKLKYWQRIALSLSDVVFIMLIHVKMPTIVGILTFMSRINFMLS